MGSLSVLRRFLELFCKSLRCLTSFRKKKREKKTAENYIFYPDYVSYTVSAALNMSFESLLCEEGLHYEATTK